jgi:hypothetical protein
VVPLVVGVGRHSFEGVADLALEKVWGTRESTRLVDGASATRLEVADFDVAESACFDALTELTGSSWVAAMLVQVGERASSLFGGLPLVRGRNNLLALADGPSPQVLVYGDPGAVAVDATMGALAADLLAADYEVTGTHRVWDLNWVYFADVDDLRRLVELSVSHCAIPQRWQLSLKVSADRRLAAGAGIVDADLGTVAEGVSSYAAAVMSPASYGCAAVPLPRAVE